jgi:hypothetical protein
MSAAEKPPSTIKALATLIVFGCFLSWCLIPRSTPTIETTVMSRGEQGYLRMPGVNSVPVAIDPASHDRLNTISAARDEHGMSQLVDSGRVMIVSSGTRVLVIAPGLFTSEVRILDGPHQGKSGIVSSEWVTK